jgi:hypothetical protein
VGPGQVYVVSSGKVYHPAWCNSVGNVWDENPRDCWSSKRPVLAPGKHASKVSYGTQLVSHLPPHARIPAVGSVPFSRRKASKVDFR